MLFNRRGQVTAEMAVLFAFVIAAFVFMGIYLQRATQGGTKSNVDQIGQQFSTETAWKTASKSHNLEKGKIVTTEACNQYRHGVGGTAPDGSIMDADGKATCTPSDGLGGFGIIP